MSHDHDGAAVREKWPVLIYRLQSHRGWEVYCDPDVDVAVSSSSSSFSSSSSLGKKRTNNNSSAASSKKVGGGGGGGDTNDSRKQNSTKSKSSSTTIVEELTAAPREGCIEVRKMRLRIRLFAQHKPWDAITTVANATSASSASKHIRSSNASRGGHQHGGDNTNATSKETTITDVKVGTVDSKPTKKKEEDDDGYDSDTPGPDGWNNNALLVRRRNTLLVTTRRGFGALVFQFKSVRDCIDFCDRLIFLNRNLLMPLPPSLSTSSAASSCKRRSGNEEDEERFEHDNTLSKNRRFVHGMDHREQYVAKLNSMKRRNLAILGDQEVIVPKYDKSRLLQSSNGSSIEGGTNIDDSNDDTTRMNGAKASGLSEEHTSQYEYRHESIMNYIVQLAHSEEFRGFVDEFERGLTSSLASDEVDGMDLCAALGF